MNVSILRCSCKLALCSALRKAASAKVLCTVRTAYLRPGEPDRFGSRSICRACQSGKRTRCKLAGTSPSAQAGLMDNPKKATTHTVVICLSAKCAGSIYNVAFGLFLLLLQVRRKLGKASARWYKSLWVSPTQHGQSWCMWWHVWALEAWLGSPSDTSSTLTSCQDAHCHKHSMCKPRYKLPAAQTAAGIVQLHALNQPFCIRHQAYGTPCWGQKCHSQCLQPWLFCK